MQIDFDEKIANTSTEKVIDEIAMYCNEKSKKIMIFEAVRLAMCDNNSDDLERKCIYKAMEKLGIEKSFSEKCESTIGEYIKFQNKLNDLVIG